MIPEGSLIPFFNSTPAPPKICGITNSEDAIEAVQSGAGALGINFYPLSSRAIRFDSDLGWIRRLADSFPDVARIAVVVNPESKLLYWLKDSGCFDAIQFHGDESPVFCAAMGALFPYWVKAHRIRSEEDFEGVCAFHTPFVLLDADVSGTYGGSGRTIDWGLAAKFVALHPERRLILAGGLTAENVAAAVAQVNPHAVDVAGGVELSPGRKDPAKMMKFIAAARR